MQIVTEKRETRMELLKDDGLSFNFANLFENDSLCHFLNNEETLLNDFDCLGVANQMGRGVDDLAEVNRAIKVVHSVEVVEVVEGGETTPVVEGEETTGS